MTNTAGVVSTFNTARQTVTVGSPAGSVTYGYDGDGNRVRALTQTVGGQPQTVTYDWDTVSSGLGEVVVERDATNTVQRRYSYGNGLATSVTGGGVGSFVIGDELGSVTNLVTPTGAVQAAFTYTPWGAQHTATWFIPDWLLPAISSVQVWGPA